jgi:hypothetical protein
MSHEPKHNNEPPKPPEYADRDIDLKALWMFFIGTVIFVGLSFIILRVYQTDYGVRNFDAEKKLPDFATERQLPPEDMPRLQARPLVELAVHRAGEESLINGGVAWTDASKTRARIPVTNAMEILIAKPDAFPARTK